MKGRRHIRWDRLTLVMIICILIISGVSFGIYKGISFILDKQKENRDNLQTDIIQNSETFSLTVDEFIDYKTGTLVLESEQENDNSDNCIDNTISDGDSNEPELIDLGEFRLTGYCNCEECCGVWAGGPCYNGEMPVAEWTIAVDPDVIPINSLVVINGHTYKACDTGSAINENRIDIYCNTHEECYSDFCNGYAEVYLINE